MTAELRVQSRRAPYAAWRALAATVLVMTGAVSAHTWAGGDLPTLPGILVMSAAVFTAGFLVLGRSTRLAAVLPLVAAAQFGLHESFGLVGGHAAHQASTTSAGWTWQMVTAHLGVTLLTVVLWWACQRALVTVVSLRARPASYAVALRQPRSSRVRVLASRDAYLMVSPRRGPPVVRTA